ncbi:MAG: hypothetical protein OEU92_31690, partial [Alphaproteobacteria bacterium]|nr:hypothetical protein [Alphaproteobacteria bacterium]
MAHLARLEEAVLVKFANGAPDRLATRPALGLSLRAPYQDDVLEDDVLFGENLRSRLGCIHRFVTRLVLIALMKRGISGASFRIGNHSLEIHAMLGHDPAPRFRLHRSVQVFFFWPPGFNGSRFALLCRCRFRRQSLGFETGNDFSFALGKVVDHGLREACQFERALLGVDVDLPAEVANLESKVILENQPWVLIKPVEDTAIKATHLSIRALGHIHDGEVNMRMWVTRSRHV